MGSIVESIQAITKTRLTDKVYIAACEVDSVDSLARTCNCTAIDGKTQASFTDVQLMAELDDGELKIPTVGSTIIIAYSDFVLPFALLYSSLDEIIYFGGDMGGLVKVIDLTTKLNNLENAFNDLVEKYNTHTHILALSTGTGTAAPTTTQETTVLVPTDRSEIENLNIKQG